MSRAKKVVLLSAALLILAGSAWAYSFFIGFPKTFAGRRVHRVTVWSKESHLRPELLYYAYTGPGGSEVRHGSFQRFESGSLMQQAMYREGKLEGTITYWNLFGEKTQEIYYRDGTPFGWANFNHGKLLNMRQEVTHDGRRVAVKVFEQDRYALQFKCGELISMSVDPSSGELSPIPNATRHACVEP